MFNTDEIYNEAVKNASIHYEDTTKKESSGFLLKLTILILSLLLGYFAFAYYSKFSVDETLVVQQEPIVEVKNSTEIDYIKALASLENELDDEVLKSELTVEEASETASYISTLEKEIGMKPKLHQEKHVQEPRTIVVKKGDTLQSIANRYYGNTQEYKRIIASNVTLTNSNNMIYEGQTIILPY
jgi:nucleoid-associated protein YgaU